MSNNYNKQYAEGLASKYIKDIERQKKLILKNFNDMDLENADIIEDFEEIIKSIVNECDSLIAEIKSYNFN